MNKHISKILLILLIVGLNWTGFSAVGQTLAYFNDTETSGENSFSAATLDFSLSSPADFSPEITPTASSSRSISLANDGLLGFNYNVSATNTSGVLCEHLNLTAKLRGSDVYSGTISGFNYNAGEFSTTTDNNWEFIANLTSNNPALQNQTCNFDFVFDGTQIGGAGFSDQEIISNTITSGLWLKVLINKVYYDVDSNHGTENKNEWIELYNPLNQDIDLKDWIICDNYNCRTINSHSIIKAQGYALISHDASTWNYWDVPAGVEKINLGGSFSLSNDDDMVALKNPQENIVDQMNWGTPSPSWDNYNSNLWDPGLVPTGDGGMAGRVPTAVDTNTAADWKNLALPQVTVTYPTGGGWYCNQNVTLKWTATNPNGPANDLKITLLFIRDLDKNGVVSSGDGITTIDQDIANTGSYNWQVSPCYYGYVWIRVIAVGPENFIVSNSGLSGRVFEPPAPEGISLEELPEDCCSIEMFADIIAEYEASLNENICAAPSGAQSVETVVEEVPVEEIIPEIVPEEPAVIEETPAEEPVIEEIPPAIEENPLVIEQAPVPEEPTPPPPPPLEPSNPEPNI